MSAELLTYQMGIMPNIYQECVRKPPMNSENIRGSRWFKLFGTPERAAETLAKLKCCDDSCRECPLLECDCSLSPETYIEWLLGKAVENAKY